MKASTLRVGSVLIALMSLFFMATPALAACGDHKLNFVRYTWIVDEDKQKKAVETVLDGAFQVTSHKVADANDDCIQSKGPYRFAPSAPMNLLSGSGKSIDVTAWYEDNSKEVTTFSGFPLLHEDMTLAAKGTLTLVIDGKSYQVSDFTLGVEQFVYFETTYTRWTVGCSGGKHVEGNYVDIECPAVISGENAKPKTLRFSYNRFRRDAIKQITVIGPEDK